MCSIESGGRTSHPVLIAGADWHYNECGSATEAGPQNCFGGRYGGRWGPPWPLFPQLFRVPVHICRSTNFVDFSKSFGGRSIVCHTPEREPVRACRRIQSIRWFTKYFPLKRSSMIYRSSFTERMNSSDKSDYSKEKVSETKFDLHTITCLINDAICMRFGKSFLAMPATPHRPKCRSGSWRLEVDLALCHPITLSLCS